MLGPEELKSVSGEACEMAGIIKRLVKIKSEY